MNLMNINCFINKDLLDQIKFDKLKNENLIKENEDND